MNLQCILLSLGRAINKGIIALTVMHQNCMWTIFLKRIEWEKLLMHAENVFPLAGPVKTSLFAQHTGASFWIQ